MSYTMLKKIIKFGITGGLGTVTNLVLFFILADKLGINQNAVSVFCFFIACTQNYIINHIWTFKVECDNTPISIKLWTKFLIASLLGLLVNIAVLNILTHSCKWQYKVIPQAAGIFSGTILNFIFSNFFVFKISKETTNNEQL